MHNKDCADRNKHASILSLFLYIPPSLSLSLSVSLSLPLYLPPSISLTLPLFLYLPSFLSLNKFIHIHIIMKPDYGANWVCCHFYPNNHVRVKPGSLSICYGQRTEGKQNNSQITKETRQLPLLTRGMLGFEMASRAPDPVPNLSGLSTS